MFATKVRLSDVRGGAGIKSIITKSNKAEKETQ